MQLHRLSTSSQSGFAAVRVHRVTSHQTHGRIVHNDISSGLCMSFA
jgi:hypothetical protein